MEGQEALELIRAAKLISSKQSSPIDLFKVTAAELHESLYEIENLREQLLKTARSPVKLGQLLGKLADRHDGTVSRASIIQGDQRWTIHV